MVKAVVAFVIAMLLMVPVGAYMAGRYMFWPRVVASRVNLVKVSDAIEADLKKVSEKAILLLPTFQKDAAALLEKYVSREGEPEKVPAATRLTEVFAKYPYWREAPGEKRKLLAEANSVPDLSTEWFSELLKFDHWLLFSEGGEKIPNLPNYKDLRLWATLYALRAPPKSASLALKHTAALVRSTGPLVAHLAAADILEDAIYFGDSDLDSESVAAFRRLGWAAVVILKEFWLGYDNDKLKPVLSPQIGGCAAAWEVAPLVNHVKRGLDPQFVLEMDFSKGMSTVRESLKTLMNECRLGGLEPLVISESTEGDWPYFRRFPALSLLSVSFSGYLKVYGQKP